jgi:hypothetical protein
MSLFLLFLIKYFVRFQYLDTRISTPLNIFSFNIYPSKDPDNPYLELEWVDF